MPKKASTLTNTPVKVKLSSGNKDLNLIISIINFLIINLPVLFYKDKKTF